MRNVFQGSAEMRLMLGKWVGDKIHLSFPSTRENYLLFIKKKKDFLRYVGIWVTRTNILLKINLKMVVCSYVHYEWCTLWCTLYIVIGNILSDIATENTNMVFAKYIYLAVMGLTWILEFHWGTQDLSVVEYAFLVGSSSPTRHGPSQSLCLGSRES